MDRTADLTPLQMVAGAGFVVTTLLASWLAASQGILAEGRGFDAAALGFLVCVAAALVATVYASRTVAGTLSGGFLIAGIAWISMASGPGSGHGPMVMTSLAAAIGARALPWPSLAIPLVGLPPLMAAIYHGDGRPIADIRPWEAMMGNIWLPAGAAAVAWLLAAANFKPGHRPIAQVGTLAMVILLMMTGMVPLQADEDPIPMVGLLQEVGFFLLAFFIGMNGWKSVPAAGLLAPLLATASWFVAPPHSEYLLLLVAFAYVAMPVAMLVTAAVGALLGQWIATHSGPPG